MLIRIIYSLLLIPVLFLVAGCSTVVDYTSGQADVCALHGARMTKKKVPVEYGLILPTDYSRALFVASTNRFPNAEKFLGGGCCVDTPTTAVIYICPKCEEARRLWESEHGQQQTVSQPPWTGK